MLRYLGVPFKVTIALCGDNLVMIIYCTNPDSDLKKKHVTILYHKLQESAAAGIANPIKVFTTVNRSDILTRGTFVGALGSFSDASCGFYWVEE